MKTGINKHNSVWKSFCTIFFILTSLTTSSFSQIYEGYFSGTQYYTVGNNIAKILRENDSSVFIISMGDSSGVEITKVDSLNNIIFDKRYSTQYYTGINNATATNDNGVLIAGNLMSADIAQIIKVNNSGSLQWSFAYDCGNASTFTACSELSDSTYIIGGHYYDTSGYRQPYFIRTDLSGNIITVKHLDCNANYITGIVKSNDGGYTILSGDYCNLIHYNSNDQAMWESCIRCPSGYYISLGNLINTYDGGFAVCGFYYNVQTGSSDGLVIKLDSTGNIQWQLALDAEQNDVFRSITQSADSGIIAVGGTDYSGFGTSNSILCKVDKYGQFMWSHVSNLTCILNTVVAYSNNILAGGYTGQGNGYYAMLDSNGSNCSYSYDSAYHYTTPCYSFSAMPVSLPVVPFNRIDNGYVLPGSFSYTVTCSMATKVAEAPKADELIISPNPCNDQTIIKLPAEFNIYYLALYDISGHLIFETRHSDTLNSFNLNVNNLLPSFYLVKVVSDNTVFFARLIKN